MVANDRREFQRLRLAKPILGLLNGQNALILDVGISGAYIEHYGQPTTGERFTLLFKWKGEDIEFVTQVAHSVVARHTGTTIVSHSGLRFVQAKGDSENRLNDMMAVSIGKILAAYKSNAAGTDPGDSTLSDLGAARRSRGQVSWPAEGRGKGSNRGPAPP